MLLLRKTEQVHGADWKAENVRGYCLCENCIDQYSYAQKELGKPEKEKKKK